MPDWTTLRSQMAVADRYARSGRDVTMQLPTLPPLPVPLGARLGLLGHIGFTAYFGLLDIGAPKAGDKAAWGPRVAQGKDTLYKHAIAGFNGSKGVMPAKGGRTDLSDDLIKQAVDHMVAL